MVSPESNRSPESGDVCFSHQHASARSSLPPASAGGFEGPFLFFSARFSAAFQSASARHPLQSCADLHG